MKRTIIEIAQLNEGESISQPGRSLVYVTTGKGESANEFVEEGDLVDTRDFNFKAKSDSKLILIYENQSNNRT